MKEYFLLFIFILSIIFPNGVLAADGAKIYKQRCVRCHGKNGDGKGSIGKFMNPKPANYKVRLKGMSDAQIKKSILNGKGGMPSFSDTLSSEEIDAVIKHIKMLGQK